MSETSEGQEAGRRRQIVRRLEAFSDVVIGFSLAQLGLSLVLPSHAIDFVVRPIGLVAFIITFIVVVRFWWTHFRIFRDYFVPNRLMITLNFSALAALTVQVFSLQLYLHFVPLGEGMTAARIYFGFFAASYGLLGVMFALGLRFRWLALSPRERRTGIRDVLGIFGATIGCTIGNVWTHGTANVVVEVAGIQEIVAVAPTTLFLGTLLGWLVGLALGWLVAGRAFFAD